MSYQTPITEADLHAYVDGQLTVARRGEVERYLAQHPAEAEKVRRDIGIRDQLRAHYERVLSEPVPPPLDMRSRRYGWWRPVAAAAAWLVLGIALGWLWQPATLFAPAVMAAPEALERDLVQPASFAHRVYASERLHPVEVSARDEQHLVEWLSKRLRTTLQAPNLAEAGFVLIGGRLLPSTNRMAAQFMYERKDGARVTLYIRRGDWPADQALFSYARHENLGTFYWVDGSLGYALSGNLPRPELLVLSEVVHRSIKP